MKAVSLAMAGGAAILSGMGSVQPSAEDEHANLVKIRVIPAAPVVAPGDRIQVGIHFDIQDGWHTYWPGQNDTGFGTTIGVKAPDGVEVRGPAWPAPHRHTAPGDILDHIHEGSVTPIFQIVVPEDAEVGSTISISFDLAWLVCKEMCIPGWRTVSLELPVATTPAAEASPGDLGILSDARARLPGPGAGAESFVTLKDGSATITVPRATSVAFYPDESSAKVKDLLTAGQSEGDTLRLTLDGEEPTLSGVLEAWFGPDRPSRLYQVHTGAGVAPGAKQFE